MDRGMVRGYYYGLCLMAERLETGLTQLDESADTQTYFDQFFW